jgi:hypothetical protein
MPKRSGRTLAPARRIFNVKLSAQEHERLRELAAAEGGLTMSSMLRRLLALAYEDKFPPKET